MKRAAVAAVLAACSVRAPARVDVLALTRERGTDGARRELVARVLKHRDDVGARLALAELADKMGRPGEAIEQLEAVVAQGGPIRTRWHAEDRERYARLIAARGRARLARDSPAALADLERAKGLGVDVSVAELEKAHVAHALARLRHVDVKEIAAGRAELVAADARYARHDELGVWLWLHGAKRAAFLELSAWNQGPHALDETTARAFQAASAWWHPADDDRWIVGPGIVWSPGLAQDALAQAMEGDGAWGPMLRAKVRPTRPESDGPGLTWALSYTRGEAVREPPTSETPALAAAKAALEGEALPTGDAALDDALAHSFLAPPRLPAGIDARVLAVAAYVNARVPDGLPRKQVLAIAAAYRRDAAVAERLANDAVAGAVDSAWASAAVGALFDALSDPGRARGAWQAAADGTHEAECYAGAAEAKARANDPDAALVDATTAAAASGDPAVEWTRVAHELLGAGRAQHALTASRSAIDLAGPDALAAALEVAIAASRAMGRGAQVESLEQRRAGAWPPEGGDVAADPTDPVAALAAAGTASASGAVGSARLWIASRWSPRNVEVRVALLAALDLDDVRRATIVAELVELAGDADTLRGLAAVTALR